MRRISRESVRTRIAIALTVMKPYQRTRLGVTSESVREWLAEELTERIMGSGKSEAVLLVPDMAGPAHAPWKGKWDEDEPHPFPDMPFSDH